MTQVKESLEKEVSTLRDASKNTSAEVKRLSGTISSKDIEMESLKTSIRKMQTITSSKQVKNSSNCCH